MMRGVSALGTLLLFFVLLIVLWLVWFATGGPSQPVSHSGFSLPMPQAPNVVLSEYNESALGEDLTDVNSTPRTYDQWEDGPGTEDTLTVLDYFFNFRGGGGGNVDSPYADDVQFRTGNSNTDDPDDEYVVITTSYDLEKSITVSDWTIESTVHVTKVPLGHAAQIPFLGQVNAVVPISIGPNSDVYIVTGRSPNGTSFRVNKCAGYFEQYQDFTPSLRNECPSAEEEALLTPHKVGSSAACIDFVEHIASCRLYTDAVPHSVGNLCQDFILNDLTYAGCVARHKDNPDFYKNEWRVFLNRDQELWANAHDQIVLRDENGKLIAVVEY